MRLLFIPAFLAAAAASPAAAQTAAPAPPPVTQLPPEFVDGRMVDQLGNAAGVLAKALLELPVGEIQAAIEARPVTREDRRRTIASEMGADRRNIDRDVEQGKAAMKQGGQALVRALPVITRELDRVGQQLGRALANLPSPTYPRQ